VSGPLIGVLTGTAILSALLTWGLRGLAWRLMLLDPLTPRSSHSRPTPRIGGVAVAVSGTVGWLTVQVLMGKEDVPPGIWDVFILGAVMAAGTGLTDDLISLPPSIKFGGELVALVPPVALLAPVLLQRPLWLGIALWTLLTVGYTNLFNFMDGSDGLAAGVAVISSVTFAWLAGSGQWATVSLVMGAAALGFLLFNVSPASVFMGDSGSLFLGYGFAILAATLIATGVSIVAVGLAVSPFAFDGTLTLLSRLARREPVWEAHRSHLYQRLLVAGWTHQDVAWLYWSWAVLAGVGAVAYSHALGWPRLAALCVLGAAAAGMVWLVTDVERRTAH
jgi:UDP-N-acetylmuramyl pentapeptide phosphotransferase/UDP-N-acetylglucosamine-1-phosphate transferase